MESANGVQGRGERPNGLAPDGSPPQRPQSLLPKDETEIDGCDSFQTSNDGNTTTSTLSFIASKEDAGKYLSCRSVNTVLSEESLENDWKLEIQCECRKFSIGFAGVPGKRSSLSDKIFWPIHIHSSAAKLKGFLEGEIEIFPPFVSRGVGEGSAEEI